MSSIDTKHIDFQSRQIIRAFNKTGVFGEDIYGVLGSDFIVRVSERAISTHSDKKVEFLYHETNTRVIVSVGVVDNSAQINGVKVLPIVITNPNPSIDYESIESWVNHKISVKMSELIAKSKKLAHLFRDYNVFEELNADLESESLIDMVKQHSIDVSTQELHLIYEKSGVQFYLKTGLTEDNVAIISEFKGYPLMWASPTLNIEKLIQAANHIIAE